MMTIRIIDTSIMLNLLEVPGRCSNKDIVMKQFDEYIKAKDTLVLPLATVIETGNQIAQVNGSLRYEIAKKFSEYLLKTADGEAPWSFAKSEVNLDELKYYAEHYLDYAKTGVGMGDLSIIRTFEKCKEISLGLPVMIWSTDAHLAAMRSEGEERPRRK